MENSTFHPYLSGTALKRVACICMLLDHAAASIIEYGLVNGSRYRWIWESPEVSAVIRADTILRSIGRLAFPIYCFLLVEGFVHTHDVRRYFGRLLLFAFVSEIPFDWAFWGKAFYWGHQNVYWTLALGVAAMACLRAAETGSPDSTRTFGWTMASLGCILAAEVMATDYGAMGVLLIVVLYKLREQRAAQCVLGAALAAGQQAMPTGLFAALGFVLAWFYNGRRGKCGPVQQWVFYAFYPAHLLLLGCVSNLLM